MGDGTEKNPYTREDVLKAIEENDGTAKGLDLSGKIFEQGIDLSNLDLGYIILKEARLSGANLEETKLPGADLRKADLFEVTLEGANLFGANFEEASLVTVNLEKAWLANANLERARLSDSSIDGADLYRANLKGINLANTSLSYDSKFWKVEWGNYVLGEERSEDDFYFAEETYRKLKMWHTNAGMHDTAAKFYYREKEAGRKGASRWNDRTAGWLSRAFFGHGEEWKRILIWIAGFILLFAFIYFAIGTFLPNLGELTPNTCLHSLYYSAASFITLGYGSWVQEATGLVKALGVFEAFIGFFMMTLLLVTFVRKWTR